MSRVNGRPTTFTKIQLDKGFTLHVLPTDMFKTVAIRAVLRRDLRQDEVSPNALIPFVLRRGSERHRDMAELTRFLDGMYGARFDVDSGKIGETQLLEFSLEVVGDRYLEGSSRLVQEGLRFLGDALLRPRLDDGAFVPSFVAQEVETLRRRIEGLINNKPQYALERLRKVMCADEPFGLYRYGSVEGLQAVDPAWLYRHYESILRDSPVDVFVVGDVMPEEVERWVREALPVPRGDVRPLSPPQVRLPEAVREVNEEEDVHQGILAVGYRSPVRYPDDEYEALIMYNGILGAFPHSKLFLNVREKASLAYFAASRLDPTKGIAIALAGIDPERYRQARDIMERQVDDMAAGRITNEEMEATRKALIHSLRTVRDSAHRMIDRELTGLVNGRIRPLETTIDAIRKVTRAQVVDMARRIVPDTVYFLTRAGSADPGVGAAAETSGGKGETP